MRFPSQTPPGRRSGLFRWLPVIVFCCCLAAEATAQRGATTTNATEQQQKPYLVLVSIDGFRWDFDELCDTPTLDYLAAHGLKAEALQPAFPTLTFPNHYSIATGRWPAEHGLVGNEFPSEDGRRWYRYKDRETVQDGEWYLAEPAWVTAERQGMRTAAYYFVGTEADVAGIRPSAWFPFDADVSGDERVRQVLDWLAEPPAKRPHLVTLYFEDVDDYSHWNGIGSTESLDAIRQVDAQLGQLLAGIRDLPHGDQVYVLLVSDHGMAGYRADRDPLVLDQLLDLSGTQVVEGGPYVYLYFDDTAERSAARAVRTRDIINAAWDCGTAMRPEETPPAWRVTDSKRFPDLFVQADPGCAVVSSAEMLRKMTPGDHGWAPEMPEMRGIFYAYGPRIPPGARPGLVHVTEIYPLMLSILQIEPASAAGTGALEPAAAGDGFGSLSASLPGLLLP